MLGPFLYLMPLFNNFILHDDLSRFICVVIYLFIFKAIHHFPRPHPPRATINNSLSIKLHK